MCENTSLGINILLAWKKQPTFGDAATGFPGKWRLRNEPRNSILMMRHYLHYLVLLIGPALWEIGFNQSEALPRSGKWRVTSMEFLRSFLKHHLVGKPVAASTNVGCFLRLNLYHPHSSSILHVHVLTFQLSLCLRPILLLLCEQLPVVMKTKQKYNKYI